MKQNRNFFWVSLLGVLVLGSVTPVEANVSSVLRRLAGPIGRFFVQETSEGQALLRSLGASDERALALKLMAPDANELANSLGGRLRTIERELFYRSLLDDAFDAESVLRTLIASELKLAARVPGRISFVISETEETYRATVLAVEAKLKETKQASSLVGKVLARSQSKFVGTELDLRFGHWQSVKAEMNTPGLRAGRAVFEDCQLVEAVWLDAQAARAEIVGGTVENMIADGANFQNSIWRGQIRIDGASFRHADFRGADMRGMEAGTLFDAGRAHGLIGRVDFTGAIFDEATKLPFPRERALELGMVFLR
ncbi:MAG: pentapeptide repeat-containing protein [Bacteriovoracia bacterium]